jgi:2-keto-4-pentenoate hydratase/2-oxohepta-3-ene-1,7-dioic acid hydratase in catechol pathway
VRISTVLLDGHHALIAEHGEGPRVLGEPFTGLSLGQVLARPRLAGDCRDAYARGVPVPVGAAVRHVAPVSVSAKIFCAGFNYPAPGRKRPDQPTLFSRTISSLVAHEQPVVLPRVSDFLDWEGEIAVVIGKPARHVSACNGWEHVAALTCFADNTVRDFAKHGTQATAGKNFEASGAIGPALSVLDGAPEEAGIMLATRVNGEQVQAGTLDELLYSVGDLISYLSEVTTLEPGDVIATGTPAGIGARQQPPRYLRPGDVVEVETTGVGVLRNVVRQEEVA